MIALFLALLSIEVQVIHISSHPLAAQSSDSTILDKAWFDRRLNEEPPPESADDDFWLFEGDLKIPYELYKEYYLPDDGKESKRAAVKDEEKLWKEGDIYGHVSYTYGENVRPYLKHRIRETMDYIEEVTCLRFLNKKGRKAYIRFTADNSKRCYTEGVGRQGKYQRLTINFGTKKAKCDKRGTINHEILHAIGFWHEHSRPDRDNYITILEKNIGRKYLHNFRKIDKEDVDSRGSEYDYASMMHYALIVLDGKIKAMRVNNPDAYRNQGSPEIGQRRRMSQRDIEQIKSMYKCFDNKGMTGRLTVTIKEGMKLAKYVIAGESIRPYVKVTAVDISGKKMISKSTKPSHVKIRSTSVTTWNEDFNFGGGKWSFFRIQLFDGYASPNLADVVLTVSETVPITVTKSGVLGKHCEEPEECETAINYSYMLSQECLSKPCKNGGTCVYTETSYICSCTSEYEGKHCQNHKEGYLIFIAEYGKDIPLNYEGRPWLFYWGSVKSSPYIKVTAYDQYKFGNSALTHVKEHTQNPKWNEELKLGKNLWRKMQVQVLDKIVGGELNCSKTYDLTKYEVQKNVKLECSKGGYVIFDYQFSSSKTLVQKMFCHEEKNPCLNGGTCIEKATSSGCICPVGYRGDKCQYENLDDDGGLRQQIA